MKKILFLVVVGLSLMACKKTTDNNDNNNDENQKLTGLIKSIKQNDTLLVEFSYNEKRQLTKKIIHNGSYQLTVDYEYLDNKLSLETAKSNGIQVYQYSLSYVNDRLDHFTINGVIQSYWEMHYDTEGKIDYAIENISGAPSIKHEYTYSGDNITEAIEYNRFGDTWELQSRFEFEYDQKHNPYFDLNLPFSEVLDEFASFVSPDNANRTKEYDNSGVLIDDIQYQSTYNAEAYPTQTIEGNKTYTFMYYQ